MTPPVALRIRFSSVTRAFELFHLFPPDLDYLDGCSAKRDGDSKVMRLYLSAPERLEDFVDLCASHPDVVEVRPITEEEFCRAPSNAI